MEESTSIAVSITAFVAAVAFIASYGCQQCEQTTRMKIKAESDRMSAEVQLIRDGWIQKQNLGNDGYLWEKP